MFDGITFGNYIPTNSFVHRIDPRVKLLATCGLSIVVFIVGNPFGYLMLASIIFLGIIGSRVNPIIIFKGIRSLIWLFLITFILNAAFIEGHKVFGIGFINITREGLVYGGQMVVRLTILLLASSLLTVSTSPMQLTDGLEALLKPFSRFGLPAHDLAMMMSIALRFIPTLIEEAQRIAAAQASRGASFDSGGLAVRSKAIISLMVPLFISSFRRADELAIAMESRCYNGGEGRTRMNPLSAKPTDIIVLLGISLILAASLAV